MPDVSKWIKLTLKNRSFPTVIAVWLSCHACIWTFKITIWHQFLTVDHHFVRRGCAGPHQICILPHVWMSDLRDLWRGLPVPKRNSHSTTCLGVRNARSPQTAAAGKEVSHFTTPHVCPSDTRHLRRGLPKDKQDPHFATRLGVRHAAEGNDS